MQKGMRNFVAILLTVLVAAVTFAAIAAIIDGWFSEIRPAREPDRISGTQSAVYTAGATASTTRIQGGDVYETAVAISQIIYPANVEDTKPGAVILVRADRFHDTLLATRVLHFPVDAPILYVDQNSMPEATRKELERLDPEGVHMDENVRVYLLGDIGPKVEDEVRRLGLKSRRITGDDPVTLSYNVDNWTSTLHASFIKEVAIVPIENPEFGLPAASWNAHMGQGMFFVERNRVPDLTKRALEQRWPTIPFIYLLGSENVISTEVANELAAYGYVQRVPGEDPYELSAVFAGWKDLGQDIGWWFGELPRDFAWGLAKPGHNYTIGNPDDWQSITPAAILSHRGKHGPILLVNSDSIPERVASYLEMVRPTYASPNAQVFNHGWIIGGTDAVSDEVQGDIEQLVAVPVPDPGRRGRPGSERNR